jgi:hypothetical protein
MYSDYCSNFETGSALVQKLRQSSSAFQGVLDKGIAMCNGHNLEDFLIMPVQRSSTILCLILLRVMLQNFLTWLVGWARTGVPRYRLLLESLLKHTESEHADFEKLTAALQIVSEKANEINQKMALASQQRKTMELATRFVSLPLEEGLVQPYRYLVTEFVFDSYNTDGSSKRFVFGNHFSTASFLLLGCSAFCSLAELCSTG